MEETAFREAMRRDPHDETTRLVYADWLDEHDRPQAAARMRWWVGAMRHLRDPQTASPHPIQQNTTYTENRLPEWVARLNQVHGVRQLFEDTPAGQHAGVADALHAAELHALGVTDNADFDAARRRALAIAPRQFRHDGRAVWAATYGVLRANAHHTHDESPQHDAHIHRATAMSLPTTYSGPGLLRVQHDTQRLAEYAQRESPVKLARVPEWIRRWFAKPAPVRALGDGIVYTSKDNPTGVFAERTAIQHALRLRGDPSHTDPKQIEKYTSAVARFVKENPEHAAVKRYVDAAKLLGGTAGPELTQATIPLVGAANMILSAAGLDKPHMRPEAEGKRAAFEHRSSTEPPVELPEEETPAPKEDRHAAVLRMTRANAPTEDILTHLQTVHSAKDRKTAQAWRRAALNRALALHQKTQGPTKLASYKGGAIAAKHLTNVAYKDPYTGVSKRVHPLMEGTALAFHLRQIAQQHPELAEDTERALAWAPHSSQKDADPYAHLGRKLEALKHPMARAYNWHDMEAGLLRDAQVNAFVRKHVLSNDWDRIYRTADKSAELKKRFEREHGGRITWDQALESIHRQADRELDRKYLGAEHPEAPSDPQYWRGVLGASPSQKHAKFSRREGDHAE